MARGPAGAARGGEGADAAAATSWRGGGRSCRGFGSKRTIDSRPPRGNASLPDLFRGRSQLLIYHFMFGPDYTAGCPACSAIADGFNDSVVHLANHDVMLWAVSRAPFPKLQEYERRMEWTFPWASSFGSDFNHDFCVGITEEEQREGAEYNYRREEPLKDSEKATIASRSTPDGATLSRP